MGTIEIKRWLDGSVLWSGEAESVRDAVQKAVASGANLTVANLEGANLEGANLFGANLVRAHLKDANLVRANLEGAYLDGAYLEGALLEGALLVRANLVRANLVGAHLEDAYLEGANLAGANLAGAVMPDGRPWEIYALDPLAGICDEPAARERAIAAWGEHTWEACPMHAAHGWTGIRDAPADKRIAVAAFVATFDGDLLREPASPQASPEESPRPG